MVKLVIFDMDGTLVDTLTDIAHACNHALRVGGFSVHPVEEYREFIGRGPLHLIRSALPEQNRDDDTVKTVRGYFHKYYSAHSKDNTKPYDGMVKTVETLRASGVSVAVCSNKPHKDAVEMGGVYFPGLIDMTVGFTDGIKPKPDPESALMIIRRFGTSLEETVYIGDSGVDMQTGRNLGVTTVGAGWGFRPKKELEDCGADVIIDKAEDLLKIVLDK